MERRILSASTARRGVATALATATLVGASAAVALGATDWVTGSGRERLLAEPVGPAGVSWSASPLRRAVEDLSHAKRLAILIDRRIDPGQQLTLDLQNVSLQAALQRIASDRGLGIAQLGAVTYFGPPPVASRLRAISALRAEDVRRLPARVGRKFLEAKPMEWADFATPRALIARLAEQNRLTIRGLDQVPHDLWAAADLPALSLVDRLTLILVQFNLTYRVSADGKTITLAPAPDSVVRGAAPLDGVALDGGNPSGRRTESGATQSGAVTPDAQVKIETIRIDKLSVQEVPVGQLLEALAARLKLQLVIDRKALEEAGVSLRKPVSLTVKDVGVDALFREVTRDTGLRFRRRGNVLEIGPAR